MLLFVLLRVSPGGEDTNETRFLLGLGVFVSGGFGVNGQGIRFVLTVLRMMEEEKGVYIKLRILPSGFHMEANTLMRPAF